MSKVLALIGFVIALSLSATVGAGAMDRQDEAESQKALYYKLGLWDINHDEDVDDELFIAQLKLKFEQSIALANNAAAEFSRHYLTKGENHE